MKLSNDDADDIYDCEHLFKMTWLEEVEIHFDTIIQHQKLFYSIIDINQSSWWSLEVSLLTSFFLIKCPFIFEKIGPVRAKLTEKLTSLGSYRQTLADLPENCIYIYIYIYIYVCVYVCVCVCVCIGRFPLFLRFEGCVRWNITLSTYSIFTAFIWLSKRNIKLIIL